MNKKGLPDGWKEVKLGEVANILMGQSPKSESYNINGDGVPFYQGVTEFTDRNVKIKTFTNQPKKVVKANTILFSVRAPVGRVNFVRHQACIGRGNAGIVMKNGLQNFLFYLLKYIEKQIQSYTSGTVFTSINSKDLKNLPIKAPPLPEQQKIAEILSSLDDKIELNNQMNKNLENMAQTIFKHWFVDFEFPDENGKPYASNGGKFVDSEMGLIPEGWNIGTLGDIIKIIHGYAFKGSDFSKNKTNLLVLTPGNVKIGGGFKSSKYKYLNKDIAFPNKYIFKEDDIMVTMTDLSKQGDTLGYPAFIPKSNNSLFLHNQRLGKVKLLNKKISKFFLYYTMCSRKYRGTILGSSTGSTVKHTAPKRILAHKILIQREEYSLRIQDHFENIIKPIMNKIKENKFENKHLKKVKDSLLPKLMSGEIRVKDFGK